MGTRLWLGSLGLPGGPVGVDVYCALGAGGVVAGAAPGVVFGFRDEGSEDRVAVDVPELFEALLLGVDVEVVVAGLPELVAVPLRSFDVSCLRTLRVVARSVSVGSERSRWTCSGMRT